MKNGNDKSPVAALLWSFACAGFGQLYNRDYIIAFTLLALELFINFNSNLNLSLEYTFQGEFKKAHEITNFEYGLFYPSLWGFSMWQAYNKARKINNDNSPTKPNLTGLFFGSVAGMNIGLISFVGNGFPFSSLFQSPVIAGIAGGALGGVIGHFAESLRKKT